MNMKIRNMTSANGRSIPNQFIIESEGRGSLGNFTRKQVFQSYESVIAIKTIWPDITVIELDSTYWNCSRTTGKYRNQFLDETKAETQAKIDKGIYILTDLN